MFGGKEREEADDAWGDNFLYFAKNCWRTLSNGSCSRHQYGANEHVKRFRKLIHFTGRKKRTESLEDPAIRKAGF